MADNTLIIQVGFESDKKQKPFKDLERKAGVAGKKAGSKFDESFKTQTQKTSIGITKGFIAIAAAVKVVTASFSTLSDSFDNVRSFGRELANINSILPTTGKLTDDTRISLERLSVQFGSNKSKQAKAFYNIVSAGVKGTARQLKTLAIANEAATAGLVDIDTAAKAIVSSVNSYAKAGLTATEASDALFVAVREGQTTFGELSDTVGNVTSIASNAGVTFNELAGAIAFVTKSGIKTDIAVTGLRQVFASVLKPTKEAADEAKRLGLEFSTASIRSKGLANFLKEVQEKSGGSEKSLAKLFGNVRALAPILNIVNGNFEDFNRILKETESSMGATATAAAEIKESLDFRLKQLNSDWRAFGDNIIKIVLPAIESVISKMRTLSTIANKWTGDQTKAEKANELVSESIIRQAHEVSLLKAAIEKIQQKKKGFYDSRTDDEIKKVIILRERLKELAKTKFKVPTPDAVPDPPSGDGDGDDPDPPPSLSDEAVAIAKANASRLKGLLANTSAAIKAKFDLDRAFLLEQGELKKLDATMLNEALVQLEAEKNAKIDAMDLARLNKSKVNFTNLAAAFKANSKNIKANALDVARTMQTTFAAGIGKSFSKVGAALRNGTSAWEAFADGLKGVAGDIAASVGDLYIKWGIANIASQNYGVGAAQLAAGAGLKILGGFLGASGGGGGAASASAPSESTGDFSGTGIEDEQEVEERTTKTEVTLNVEGSLVRQEELGQYIADTLNEVSQKNDFALIDARFA